MDYLTYNEYQELGGTLEEAAFNRNKQRAFGIIDNHTFGRVAAMSKVPQAVKILCIELIEYLSSGYGGKQVSSRSQSAGSVSESENYVVNSIEERDSEIDNMVKDYLLSVKDDNGVPLLYRGCGR